MPLSLETTHVELGWPTAEQIEHPQGAGPRVYASLVKEKIGRSLIRFDDAKGAVLGILVPDSNSSATQTPFAIVVDFERAVSESTLRELQRLSWNFSHSPILITLEPHLFRVWTCCESPDPTRSLESYIVHQLSSEELISTERGASLDARAVRALHWVNLVSGSFVEERTERFNRDGRADQMLLGNLRYIRTRLRQAGLEDHDVCHDLLARIIFVQFLFDRKDSDGVAALTASRLLRLQQEGVLVRVHSTFDSILSDYGDTYRLFDWLNTKFNGDLFPGKGDTPNARAEGWAAEKRAVTRDHLSMLADFVRGDLYMPTGQAHLWPQYSFDVIPLEFISSIYETFVTERAARDGIFYTPPHLVDFIFDRVLPWEGEEWDLKIFDPACGSGIFLVKAFQRLVYRWKRSHPDQTIRAEVLRRLLERNIFGVDKDRHAVRVACFSLYLAMCDEIEPRHYWAQVLFPRMREKRLIFSDFFAEERPGFQTGGDRESYDLIVGNAPWGDGLVTEEAKAWARAPDHRWTVANKDIGGLFLSKASHLVRPNGCVAMIQSANSLLFNGSSKAALFRKQLFTSTRVKEVYNLSVLRFKVFSKKAHATKLSVAPACIVVLYPGLPDAEDRITYVSPKQLRPLLDEFSILLEPGDLKSLTVREAWSDPLVWSVLLWGTNRDRALIRRLQSYPSLCKPPDGQTVLRRQGIIRGDRRRSDHSLEKRRFFDRKAFPSDSLIYLDAESLPFAGELRTHSRDSKDFRAFASPQLLLKQGWQKSLGRFQARLVTSNTDEGVLCNKSYVTVHSSEDLLEAAWMVFNSKLAVYFLQLTSGRMAAYRPEALVHDLLAIPIPSKAHERPTTFETFEAIDEGVFRAFGLKDAERVLVEDMLDYTLADFRGAEEPDASRPIQRSDRTAKEYDLRNYCEYVVRVLRAGFGLEKPVKATVFEQADGASLPYRLVSFELGTHSSEGITTSRIATPALMRELERLDFSSSKVGGSRRGIYNERLARIYDGSTGIPTIFVVKPGARKYWTRSAGLTDGDEIASDLFLWQQQAVIKENGLQ